MTVVGDEYAPPRRVGSKDMTEINDSLSSGEDRTIVLDQLARNFSTAQGTVTAVAPLSLTIPSGQFMSVLGPSGCGKTTLLRLAAGLLEPSSGSVRVGSRPVSGPYTDLGIVFQRDLLLEWRTALDNILLQVEMRGLRREDYKDRAYELLEQVGIREFADAYPSQMSGGMRQRVSICRALVHDPPVLLMDEPFGALDALTRDEIALDLAWLCERSKKTVLFITHSIGEAVFLSDRILVMSARPAQVKRDMLIELPRPRELAVRDTTDFAHLLNEIRMLLFDPNRIRRSQRQTQGHDNG